MIDRLPGAPGRRRFALLRSRLQVRAGDRRNPRRSRDRRYNARTTFRGSGSAGFAEPLTARKNLRFRRVAAEEFPAVGLLACMPGVPGGRLNNITLERVRRNHHETNDQNCPRRLGCACSRAHDGQLACAAERDDLLHLQRRLRQRRQSRRARRRRRALPAAREGGRRERAKTWRAYLSTTGAKSVNARDRIGRGPWQNAKGEVVARTLDDLHSDKNNLNKQTALTETGQVVNGRGDKPNMHDILTGSDLGRPRGRRRRQGHDLQQLDERRRRLGHRRAS